MLTELKDIDLKIIKLADKDIHNMIIASEVKEFGKISDGYHTFDELYEHRNMLYIVLTNLVSKNSWKSKVHNDGTTFDGWFILGCVLNSKQVTYHLPLKLWDLSYARELDRGLVWDGHESKDVLERLRSFNKLIKENHESKNS